MSIINTIEIPLDEAHRQISICNACRYCEGLCDVFPAMSDKRLLADSDIIQLANLCHNCRGCYYACQYTLPHEFRLNLPKALAEVRQDSWQYYATPRLFARGFHQHGVWILGGIILSLFCFIALLSLTSASSASGFYDVMSHNTMIAIFIPAFMLPILSLAISLRHYWRDIGGKRLRFSQLKQAFYSVLTLRNLSGGHGKGCNFEDEDRFSQARRYCHHGVMYGFLLCFGATTSATLLHYIWDIPAPYPLLSLPKILGLTGGILLCIGCAGMAYLKLKADKNLGDTRVWGGEMAFILLLFLVSATGLCLYFWGHSDYLFILLALHLACVFSFFLLIPFSKMAHGFYRLAALLYNSRHSE